MARIQIFLCVFPIIFLLDLHLVGKCIAQEEQEMAPPPALPNSEDFNRCLDTCLADVLKLNLTINGVSATSSNCASFCLRKEQVEFTVKEITCIRKCLTTGKVSLEFLSKDVQLSVRDSLVHHECIEKCASTIDCNLAFDLNRCEIERCKTKVCLPKSEEKRDACNLSCQNKEFRLKFVSIFDSEADYQPGN